MYDFLELTFNQYWMDDAACIGVPTEVFFADGFGGDRKEIERDAKKLCRSCPVRHECLSFALKNGEHHGIWGGKNPAERHRIRKNERITT